MTWTAELLCHSRISMWSNKQKQNFTWAMPGCARVWNCQCVHLSCLCQIPCKLYPFNIEAMYVGASWFSALRLGIRELYYVGCNFVSSHSICCCCWERPEGMMVLCQYSSNRQSLMWFWMYVKLLHTCLWIVWNYITEKKKNSWLIMREVVILVAAKLRKQRLREVYFSIRD